jgi:hypothetical protein
MTCARHCFDVNIFTKPIFQKYHLVTNLSKTVTTFYSISVNFTNFCGVRCIW